MKNIFNLPEPYDANRSSENGFTSVRPLYAFTLIEAVQNIVTVIILATVLLISTTLDRSLVQLLITGASATSGIALNADTMVRPPMPHFLNTAPATPMK